MIVEIMYDTSTSFDITQNVMNIAHGVRLTPEFNAAITRLRLLNYNVEILPKMTWRGYIAFNVSWDQLPYGTPFKMVIYDLVTRTDPAGNPLRKTGFEFHFVKKTKTIVEERDPITGKVIKTYEQ